MTSSVEEKPRRGLRSRLQIPQRTKKEIPAWRKQAFEGFSSAVEIPMLILAVVMIPVIIVPLVMHLSPGAQSIVDTLDYFIWTIFAFEYITRITLAPLRWHFFTHNLFDLVVVAVPMLRPLKLVESIKALRLLRLTRLGGFAGEGAQKTRKSLHSRVLEYVAVVTGLLLLVTSLVVWDLERGAPGASIKTWPDSLWWAIQTVTTVGYGDKVPVTAGGRAVASVLMLVGIGLLAVITAGIAAVFVRDLTADQSGVPEPTIADVIGRLQAIEAVMTQLLTVAAGVPAATAGRAPTVGPSGAD
jgi:voltage-gated potassium channel